ncbi:helix-turn-helix domain-containing protein [Comamonas sp. GB3 AK4-5]|uniref:AraC family transcriptional regulator n=1 Tax=Comamonas sp. GB3 AK4-5 TaxID=3231487 RepID=UPI00351EF22D
MHAASLSLPTCPPAQARAPRWQGCAPHAQLYLPPPSLQGGLQALVCRDTRGLGLSDAQRLSHFPATPMVCLSWTQQGRNGMVVQTADGRSLWQEYESPVMLSGSQTRPTVGWMPDAGYGGMACFSPDAAQQLFGLDLQATQDCFVPAAQALGPAWQPLCEALLAAQDGRTLMAVLEQHLAPRWREVRSCDAEAPPSLAASGRHWLMRLGLKARAWRAQLGPRQVERRIKLFSGRSVREWQAIVRTEALFEEGVRRQQQGLTLDYADLALQGGFSDQAHMSRAVHRITGFSPAEFARRYEQDESFWPYRLWI